jgi:hypothetical protein
VVKDRVTVDSGTTSSEGKISFVLYEPGEYMFYSTKPGYFADSHRTELRQCGTPLLEFRPMLEIGSEQVITLKAQDGNVMRDFNVVLVFPDNTTKTLQAKDGVVILELENAGTYEATVQTAGYQSSFTFEATAPFQVVPEISDNAKPAIQAVFGEETVEKPNYLIIWILAIASISGLIIQVTKFRPVWFRFFISATYTTTPILVNHYTKSILLAFIVIVIETLILTALWFQQWKAKRQILPETPIRAEAPWLKK